MAEKHKEFTESFRGLLIYFGKNAKLPLIKNLMQLLEKNDIPAYYINDKNFNVTISQLINCIGTEQKWDNIISWDNQNNENILFFSGFARDEIENFLTILRDSKFPRFELKAVATKTNQKFTLATLIEELRQDRISISLAITLRKEVHLLKQKSFKIINQTLKKETESEILHIENMLSDMEKNFDMYQFKNSITKAKKLIQKIDDEKAI